jgi:membrane protease YdiL (CAAX protease family)
MPAYALDARNPYLVLVWTFGLFMLMHGHQYIGALLAARADRVSFDSLMSGKHETPRSILLRGLAAIVVGLPLIWLCSTLLWNRPLAWMGLGFHWGWLLLGIGMGACAPFLIVFVLSRMKLAEVRLARHGLRNSEMVSAVLGLTMMALFAGISEEIIFRGMMGLELSLAWGWPISILVVGAFFGLVHLLGQLKTLTLQLVSIWLGIMPPRFCWD